MFGHWSLKIWESLLSRRYVVDSAQTQDSYLFAFSIFIFDPKSCLHNTKIILATGLWKCEKVCYRSRRYIVDSAQDLNFVDSAQTQDSYFGRESCQRGAPCSYCSLREQILWLWCNCAFFKHVYRLSCNFLVQFCKHVYRLCCNLPLLTRTSMASETSINVLNAGGEFKTQNICRRSLTLQQSYSISTEIGANACIL